MQHGSRTTTYFLLLDTPALGTAFLTAERAGELSAASLYLYLYGGYVAPLPDLWTPWFAQPVPMPDAGPAPGQ